jgi:hypothetical protein
MKFRYKMIKTKSLHGEKPVLNTLIYFLHRIKCCIALDNIPRDDSVITTNLVEYLLRYMTIYSICNYCRIYRTWIWNNFADKNKSIKDLTQHIVIFRSSQITKIVILRKRTHSNSWIMLENIGFKQKKEGLTNLVIENSPRIDSL